MANEQKMMISSFRAEGMGYGSIARCVTDGKWKSIRRKCVQFFPG